MSQTSPGQREIWQAEQTYWTLVKERDAKERSHTTG
jgi:hypothetical protein